MSCNFNYGGGTYIPTAAQGRTPMGMFNAAVPPTVIPPAPTPVIPYRTDTISQMEINPIMGAQAMAPAATGNTTTAIPFNPDRFPVGMGYVPMQKWETPCPMDRALIQGTIFPSLDLPFVGRCR